MGMYDDDEYDGRNATVIRRAVPVARPLAAPAYRAPIQVGSNYGPPLYAPPMGYPGPYPAPYAPPGYPWQPAPVANSPLVDRVTGTLKLGMVLDIAAQALAAMASLPAAPQMVESALTNAQNQVKYQEALAQHGKRDEQIRTLGALARLFLV